MNSAVPVRCLSFHVSYACENTGVCCSSGWRIAVETTVEASLRTRLKAVRERLPNDTDGFSAMDTPPASCRNALRLTPSGACWFRDERDHRCSIHRELGEPSLPSACRQFPRVCVLEPGSVSLSFSHYCPTAAGLLFLPWGPIEIVEPAALQGREFPLEGLDVRESYPPFLRRDVLLGFDGLRALEWEATRLLSLQEARSAVARVTDAIAAIHGWTPDQGPMEAAVREGFRGAAGTAQVATDPRPVLRASVPEGAASEPLPTWNPGCAAIDVSIDVDRALRRYLAARLFGCWPAYFAERLETVGRYLALCFDTVSMFAAAEPPGLSETERWKAAIRRTDLWLLHLCDPERLTRNLG